LEGLSPPLKCLIQIQSSIANGESVRTSIARYLGLVDVSDSFGHAVRKFLFAWEQGHEWRPALRNVSSSHRRALIEILACGLAGQPISPHLESLKGEIISACDLEIKDHLDMLPLKMLAPLLLFQFPAFLLLLFGPLLRHLVEELNR
jgi:hypothetical protein